MCLDHQPTRDAKQAAACGHYNYVQHKNMEAKRKVPSCAGSSIWNGVSRREGWHRSRDATDVTNREAAICWDGAA